jgi:two-component system cell cycle sensor histidine kinase/response regulator CckA
MSNKRIRDEQLERASAAREEHWVKNQEAYPSQRPKSEIRAPTKATAGRVLVVDDDALVLAMTERTLRRHGFTIITAADGPTALQIYREEGHAIDLVVLDVTMPDMSGIETCIALYELDDDVRVIFSSGYDAEVAESQELPDCVEAFVQKPYRPSELAELMQRLLDSK